MTWAQMTNPDAVVVPSVKNVMSSAAFKVSPDGKDGPEIRPVGMVMSVRRRDTDKELDILWARELS